MSGAAKQTWIQRHARDGPRTLSEKLFVVLGKLAAHPRVRRAYYRLKNAHQFADLRQHELMLADKIRNEAYSRAIHQYVHAGDVVLDLGTGTGLLACMASSNEPSIVYAIDHAEIIHTAEEIASANGIRNIQFFQTNSRSFTSDRLIDVIIHEQIGNALFEESMVSNVLDLRDRLMRTGGRILPNRFAVYVEPISLKDDYRVPFIWEQVIAGVDFGRLRPPTTNKAAGGARYCNFVDSYEIDHLLADPEPAFAFDLQNMDQDSVPRQIQTTRTVRRAGRLDGYCFYFDVRFADSLAFSTSPAAPRTHWRSTLLRVEPKDYEPGQSIDFTLTMPELSDPMTWTWWYR